MEEDYFELAQGSSVRMCRELEKRFPDFRGRQLELMLYLSLVAYDSEIYDGVCENAWLRTTIKLNNHRRDEVCYPANYQDRLHIFSPAESPEFKEMAELSDFPVLCQAYWKWLQIHQPTLTSRIEIRSNILPRQSYWDKLQELQAASVEAAVLDARRGFYPITVINQACLGRVALNELRRNRLERCELATHLQRPTVRAPPPRNVDPHGVPLRNIDPDEVVTMKKGQLGGGNSATVYKISWRQGTYAMKSYPPGSLRQNEINYIALRVLHPHIVHGFGYFTEDGGWRLLMEVLGTSLTVYAVENVKRVASRLVKPLFARAEDTFDVLLQIASAMEHLHVNGVVHGDLKPENILLDQFEVVGNGRHFLAKVTDFGDAMVIEPGVAFRPAGDGTTRYAAPELLEWRKNRDGVRIDHPKKIDVYGFGAVAHEVLTGYPVYHGHDASSRDFQARVKSGKLKQSEYTKWRTLKWTMRCKAWKVLGLKERFPVALLELVERCWEWRPEDRPEFSEIRAKLENYKSSMQTSDHRAADIWKFIAAVFLVLALICFASRI